MHFAARSHEPKLSRLFVEHADRLEEIGLIGSVQRLLKAKNNKKETPIDCATIMHKEYLQNALDAAVSRNGGKVMYDFDSIFQKLDPDEEDIIKTYLKNPNTFWNKYSIKNGGENSNENANENSENDPKYHSENDPSENINKDANEDSNEDSDEDSNEKSNEDLNEDLDEDWNGKTKKSLLEYLDGISVERRLKWAAKLFRIRLMKRHKKLDEQYEANRRQLASGKIGESSRS